MNFAESLGLSAPASPLPERSAMAVDYSAEAVERRKRAAEVAQKMLTSTHSIFETM